MEIISSGWPKDETTRCARAQRVLFLMCPECLSTRLLAEYNYPSKNKKVHSTHSLDDSAYDRSFHPRRGSISLRRLCLVGDTGLVLASRDFIADRSDFSPLNS